MIVGILIGSFALMFYGFLFSEMIRDIIKDCKENKKKTKTDLKETLSN